ncbi:hypothetical protein J0H58_24625 [bacterium]|nr:hypothetical protein [bacterium]
MTRLLLLALAAAACAVVVAAPIPEESDADRLYRLYGRWVHPHRSCKHQLVGSALRVALPAESHALGHRAEAPGNAPRTATVVAGDFTVVVKVAVTPQPAARSLAASAGLYAASDRDEFVTARQYAGVGREFTLQDHHLVPGRQLASMTARAAAPAGAPLLRITRKGATAATAWSEDGKNWNALYEHEVGWDERVTVGVFAENRSGVPAGVTFDRFTLTQPKK